MITSKLSLVQHFFPHGPFVAKKHPPKPQDWQESMLQGGWIASRLVPCQPFPFSVGAFDFCFRGCEVWFNGSFIFSTEFACYIYKCIYSLVMSHTYIWHTYCISGTNTNLINMHRTVPEKSKRTYTCYIPMNICHRRHSPLTEPRWSSVAARNRKCPVATISY